MILYFTIKIIFYVISIKLYIIIYLVGISYKLRKTCEWSYTKF